MKIRPFGAELFHA